MELSAAKARLGKASSTSQTHTCTHNMHFAHTHTSTRVCARAMAHLVPRALSLRLDPTGSWVASTANPLPPKKKNF